MTLVFALRGAAAIVVLTTLAGGVPRVIQVALAVTLGLWSAFVVAPPIAGTGPTVIQDWIDGVTWQLTARELVAGAAVGLMAAIPLLAAAAAGRLVDLAATSRSHGPYGTLFGVLAAAVFVGIDGHVAVIAAIVDSHRATSEAGVVAAIAGLVPAAVRLAVPWLVTAAVVEIAVGAGVRVAGRAGLAAPIGVAVPAALVAVTASLVGVLAVAMARLVG
jgi:flagellar biosynthesis protein FliR